MLKFDLQKPNDVVAFGRATIDLYANEIGPMEEAKTFSKYVGGSPANTAVAMARLGLKVGYIGKVSDDQFGRFIVRYLADQGGERDGCGTEQASRYRAPVPQCQAVCFRQEGDGVCHQH